MIVCHSCRAGADKVKCAIEFVKSGYTSELACERDIEMDHGTEGRHNTDILKCEIAVQRSSFPQGRLAA